jgi:hypothetical protein
MVVVDVGEQDSVDSGQFGGVQRNAAAQVADPGPQNRIRQQTDAVQLDQDGRMPDVQQPGRCYLTPASSGPYAASAAITSTSSAMIRIDQTG